MGLVLHARSNDAILCLCLLLFGCLPACMSHRQPNSDCEWPKEADAEPLNLNQASQRQHVSDDAEFAEDLAIRYADSHRGLHTNHFEGTAEYERARDACMAALFKVIGSSHTVTEEEVRQSLGHRHNGFDLAIMLSFSLLYAWIVSILARWLCQLYGPGEELTTIVTMTTLASALVSAAGVMLGEVWSGFWEMFRIGNGHMSYRFARIPWTHHRLGLFIAGVVLFWLIAGLYRRNARNSKGSNASEAWVQQRPTEQ